MISGSLSFPFRGAFHLSLTVLVHYRSLNVFSLGEWSPQLPTRLHVSRGTQDPSPHLHRFSTGLSPAAVALSNAFECSVGACCWSYNPTGSCEPVVWALPGSLATT